MNVLFARYDFSKFCGLGNYLSPNVLEIVISYAFPILFENVFAKIWWLLPRVRDFWSWFGGVCSLTYCNGNFRVIMVSEPFNVIL